VQADTGKDFEAVRPERTFTKALSDAYVFRRSADVQWKAEGNRRLDAGPAEIEIQQNEFDEFAQRCKRVCRSTRSSLEPDSGGHCFTPARGVWCIADAGAVSATAPAQNPGGRFSRFANGCV